MFIDTILKYSKIAIYETNKPVNSTLARSDWLLRPRLSDRLSYSCKTIADRLSDCTCWNDLVDTRFVPLRT